MNAFCEHTLLLHHHSQGIRLDSPSTRILWDSPPHRTSRRLYNPFLSHDLRSKSQSHILVRKVKDKAKRNQVELMPHFPCSLSTHSPCRMNSKEPFPQRQTPGTVCQLPPSWGTQTTAASLFHLSLPHSMPHPDKWLPRGLHVVGTALEHGRKSKKNTNDVPCSRAAGILTPPQVSSSPISLIIK